jgi:hypothetical protein
MAKNITTTAAVVRSIKDASPKVKQIVKMLTKPGDGVTATAIQQRTGETKRRSAYSLNKLARRFGYMLDQTKYEGYRLTYYRFLDQVDGKRTADGKRVNKKASI